MACFMLFSPTEPKATSLVPSLKGMSYSDRLKFLGLPTLLNLIGCHWQLKAQFVKFKKKINSSEAIWRMKLQLCRNIHSISFYNSIVFIFTLVDMATLSFHRLLMGKMKIGLIAVLLWIFGQNFFRIVSSTKHKFFMQLTHFGLLLLLLKG